MGERTVIDLCYTLAGRLLHIVREEWEGIGVVYERKKDEESLTRPRP